MRTPVELQGSMCQRVASFAAHACCTFRTTGTDCAVDRDLVHNIYTEKLMGDF